MTSVRKHICLSLFIITLFVPCFVEAGRGIGVRPVSPAGTEVRGNQWLFVIGIDTYIDWPRLKTAVSDAKAVRDILLSRYYFNEDYVIELYDEQATRKNILKNLRQLAKNVRDDDSLVIFYAGHGHLDPITKAGSWIPVESGTKDVSAWISNHDIKNYLRVDAIKAKHILLISDSCFSGDFFRGHRGKLPEVTDEVIKRAYKLTSRQAITSGGLEPVADEGFGRNSVFSYFLVKTLKENQKPFLVPSDLFPDIKAGVAENAEQFPLLGSLTGTGGQQGGELVLFLKQDLRLKALSGQVAEGEKELERLQQMEAAADEARKKETDEIARRERELAELDAKVEEMRKRLGTQAVRTDDSLDSMLAMVQQKEQQERKLQELRRQREEEERKRRAEIARLKREREEKVIAMLALEVEKYKKIVASKYGQSMKSEAWKSLIAKTPNGWADGVGVGDYKILLLSPQERIIRHEKKERKISTQNSINGGENEHKKLIKNIALNSDVFASSYSNLRGKHLPNMVVDGDWRGGKSLNSWAIKYGDSNPWIKIIFNKQYSITNIRLKGRDETQQWSDDLFKEIVIIFSNGETIKHVLRKTRDWQSIKVNSIKSSYVKIVGKSTYSAERPGFNEIEIYGY